MKHSIAVLLLVAGLAVAACGGESKSDKASSKVCDARADIKKQVDELRGLTITTATVDGVTAKSRRSARTSARSPTPRATSTTNARSRCSRPTRPSRRR